MNITCPHCNTTTPLEERTEDASARELFGIAPRMGSAFAPLVAYLGLFKPGKQALRWSRALLLSQEVIALCDNHQALAMALSETVEAMREKRQSPNWKPLTGHNYLKKVLASTLERGASTALTTPATTPTQPQSKAAQTIDMLRNYPAPDGIPEWFTRTLCGTFAELMIMGLDNVPAADTMQLVVERWHLELWPKRKWGEHCRFRGPARLRNTITKTAEHHHRWPQARDVLEQIPEV